MRRILNHKTIAFATLIIWLLANWSGAHGHMCFDGQEPPLTVHIHTVSDHDDHSHDSNQNHLDADVGIGQLTPTTAVKIDTPFLLITALLLVIIFSKSIYSFAHYSRKTPVCLIGIRPPLRAPPRHPA